jgi:outer membrane protein, heavy metal efflux system
MTCIGLVIPLLAMLLRVAAVAQEPVLTLSGVYGIVREQNPRLHAAAALVDARRSMEASAALPPDPAVEVGVMNFSLPGLSARMPTSMAPSIQAMQMLPIGRLGLSGKIARQSTALAAADAEEVWWEVRSAAAMAFYEVWQADRQLAVMRETLQWLQNFATVARAMYAAGEGRQTDVLRAGVEVARMEADVKRMETMRTAAAATLNAVLNRPGDSPVPALAFESVPLEIPAHDTLRGWAEQYRPMLERGRTGVEQARTRRELAKRELWPDLTVGFQYGQRRTAADEMGAARTERMGSLMVGFSVPVFARQRQLAMREEAQAMERMAAADLTNMRVQVDARIAEILADLDRAHTLVALYRSQVLPQARATVESAFSSYRVGRVDFMTLVDAAMTKNRYEQNVIALLAQYGAATAELEMTIGRELPRGAVLLAEAKRAIGSRS